MWGLQIGPWDALWLFAEMHTDQIPQLAVESSSGKAVSPSGTGLLHGALCGQGQVCGGLELSQHPHCDPHPRGQVYSSSESLVLRCSLCCIPSFMVLSK